MATSKAASKTRAMTAPERGKGGAIQQYDSYEAALKAAQEQENEFESASRLDKNTLVGVPLVITSVEYRDGNNGNEYAIVKGFSKPHGAFSFLDGGKGICAELQAHEAKGGGYPLPINNGLSRSDYPEKKMDDGSTRPAGTTFWLDNGMNKDDAAAATALSKSANVMGKAANGRARA